LQLLVLAGLMALPDAVFLSHSAVVRLSPDTTMEEISDEVVIPLTTQGVARYSVLSVPYTRGSDEVDVELAEVRPCRPGRPVSPAEVAEGPRSGLSASGRLEGTFRQLTLSFRGLEIGDTVRIITRRAVERLPMAPLADYSFYFQGRDSIASSSFRLEWPSAVDLHVWQSGGPERAERAASAIRYITWLGGPESPIETLPFSVPVDEAASRVVISSASPQQVSRRLYEALDPGPPDSLTAVLLDSLASAAPPGPQALSSLVSSMISYAGAEIGADPGYTPQPPSVTLERRSGVCRDMAVLLAALLRARGTEAWVALCRNSPRLDPVVGSRSFDHMIVMAVSGRDTFWLDPSAASGGGGSGLRGQRALPLTPGGCGILQLPDPSGTDTIRIEADGALSNRLDTLSVSLKVSFAGGAEELWRGMMASVQPADRPEALRLLLGALPGSSLTLTGDPGEPGSVISVEGMAIYRVPTMPRGGGIAACIPGLDEMDQAGTRVAAILLAGSAGRPGIHLETPLFESLQMTLSLPGSVTDLSDRVESEGYSSSWELHGSSAVLTETAVLGPVWPDSGQAEMLLASLRSRSSPGGRVVVVLPSRGHM